jgi:SNF2 family DNA or RNA helicase
MLRRTKEAVLGELPRMQMNDVAVPLGPKQLAAYHMIETGRDGRTRHHLERIGQLRHVCDAFEGESAKLDWIAMRLQSISCDEKVIVFSSHLDVLRLAQSRLRNCELLTGETEPDERARIVRAFQGDDGPSLLLLSQRVGAEGITLTRANHVMFVNEWWNPSATAQAIDRIRRIGQHREMHCYRLFSPNTIEDRVRQLLLEKTAEAEEILGALRSPA